MRKKIIGVTVGTPISPSKIEEKINPVKTVNGKAPDENGNVEVEVKTNITEADPTVPSWAKQNTKPTYSKSEVGLGNVDNVRQYSASNPPPYPVSKVNNKSGNVTLTASDVGAEKSGTASSAVSSHNTNTAAHNDIRLLIEGLTTRLNTLANSTDSDLDQMAEIVAYIKANKTLIDSITTSKVSVSDIVDNLNTNVTNRPLSAAQGVALKALIDAIDLSVKLDASKLPEAINAALAQAKESGEFDGHTPVKGIDYDTPKDRAEIVNAVIAALPKYNGEVVDV